MSKLAIVMISKNQVWNIGRLIESVLHETAGMSCHEIVLVDSASMDETVTVASRYPIDILRLRPEQQLTPAAGRYVGYKHTTADFVLFLDGDMELCPGWLEKALRIMQGSPKVAAVTGQIIDLPQTGALHDKPSLGMSGMDAATEVPYCGGAAMYRRAVLEQAGTFNPYLHSDEEPELCIRIRHGGHRVIQLQYPIVYHYTSPLEAWSTLVGRWRRNLYLGAGEAIRYHVGTELFWPYLKERGFGCVPALGLAGGVISFLWSLRTRQWIRFNLWLLLVAVVVAGDTYRQHSLYRVIYSLLHRLFIVDGTVRGFLSKPMNPSSYPGQFDLIKQANREESSRYSCLET
jgi:glycosyltransferase involved in cell wall biosynthesis